VKKILFSLLILGLLVLSLIPIPVSAMTGSGTEGDPYMIYDVDDLQDMNLDTTAYYELANDIAGAATQTWNGGAGFSPINFNGHFDGNFYTISNLYQNRSDTSIFGYCSGATIENLIVMGLEIYDTYVYGMSSYVSGLATDAFLTSFSHCMVSGEITMTMDYMEHMSASLLVGVLRHSTITECATYGLITSTQLEYPNTGGAGCGGLVIVAYNPWPGNYPSSSISNSYSRVTIMTSYDLPCGLIGQCHSDVPISYCYAAGTMILTPPIFGWETVWGLTRLGYETGNDTANFWDIETTGAGASGRVNGVGHTVGVNTFEMTTESTYTDAGWDFDNIWNIDSGINSGYPYFQWMYGEYGIPTSFTRVLWFQPNNIISGTTLPDRATSDGSQDGEITWGSNPAGVSVGLTGFYSDYAPANITLPQEIITPPQDMVGPTGNPGNTRDVGTLVDNPFYPLIKGLSDHSGISVQLWWIILASIIVVAAMVVTYKFLPHQMIVALVGGGLSAFFYAMGIYPFWVVLIFAVMALAIILGERSPVV
jgi:hypothetical protein